MPANGETISIKTKSNIPVEASLSLIKRETTLAGTSLQYVFTFLLNNLECIHFFALECIHFFAFCVYNFLKNFYRYGTSRSEKTKNDAWSSHYGR